MEANTLDLGELKQEVCVADYSSAARTAGKLRMPFAILQVTRKELLRSALTTAADYIATGGTVNINAQPGLLTLAIKAAPAGN